jgi:hypothetical protein
VKGFLRDEEVPKVPNGIAGRTSNFENDPSTFFDPTPGGFDIGQWHRLYVDMELAGGSHFEQFWDRGEDPVERH